MAKKNYMVGEQVVLKKGDLEGGKPELTYKAHPYYGVHATRIAAKRAYVVAGEPEFSPAGDELIAKQFRAYSQNMKCVKIIAIDAVL